MLDDHYQVEKNHQKLRYELSVYPQQTILLVITIVALQNVTKCQLFITRITHKSL